MHSIGAVSFIDTKAIANRVAEVDLNAEATEDWHWSINVNGTDQNGDAVAAQFVAVNNYNNGGDISVNIDGIDNEIPPFTSVAFGITPFTQNIDIWAFVGTVRIYISEKQIPLNTGTDQTRANQVSGFLRRDGSEPMLADLDMGGFNLLNLGSATILNLQPETYGAKGDGATNDTEAFQKIAAVINSQGGGVISLKPGATYIVGAQDLLNDGTYMFKGQDILHLHDCSQGIIIHGNGAKIKLANGLKFGTFDASGNRTDHTLPYSGGDRSEVTFGGAIYLSGNTGSIYIDNLELDGNAANLSVGGQFGDTGRQLFGDGIFLEYNTGGVIVDNLYSHNWPRDNCYVTAITSSGLAGNNLRRNPHHFRNCIFDKGCRNCVSATGGRGLKFTNCRFSNAARTTLGLPFGSSPGSWCDVEAETGSIREIEFEDCAFVNGASTSFVCDTGDTIGIIFKRCRFDNPDNYAFWFNKPGIVCEDCRFFGGGLYADPTDLSKAGQFIRCYFSDADADSETATPMTFANMLLQGAGGGAHGNKLLLKNCVFNSGAHNAAVGTTGTIYEDCNINCNVAFAGSPGIFTDAIFRGTTTFTVSPSWPLNTWVTHPVGRVIYNGVSQFDNTVIYDPPSVPLGASGTVTTTVPVPACAMGQQVIVTFNQNNLAIDFWGYVSAAGTVTVKLSNMSGAAVDLPSGNLSVRVKDLLAA